MSNADLKPGDRVLLSYNKVWDIDDFGNPLGVVGTVLDISSHTFDFNTWVWIKWDNGYESDYLTKDNDLVKVVELTNDVDISIGDTVMLLASTNFPIEEFNLLGVKGKIVNIASMKYIDSFWLLVKFNNGNASCYKIEYNDLVKVTK